MSTLRLGRRSRRGSVVVELALIFIPLFFGIAATLEIARWLWIYQTLSSATKSAVRFAIVHGARCVEASPNCVTTVSDLSRMILRNGIGLDRNALEVTLTSPQTSRSCSGAGTCLSDTTPWPAAPFNAVGLPVGISVTYEFKPAIGFLWSGQGFQSMRLSATATEVIQF